MELSMCDASYMTFDLNILFYLIIINTHDMTMHYSHFRAEETEIHNDLTPCQSATIRCLKQTSNINKQGTSDY